MSITYSNLVPVVPENIPAMRHKASVFSWPVKAAQFDINAVKGEVEGYLTLWDDPMLQQPYEDSYKDVVCPGAFLKTIGELDQKRKFRGDDWLHPHLWQHDGKELIGGCCHLAEDDTGVFFAVKMCMGVRRAQEAVALMVDGLGLGISYGYDPIKSQPMNNRRYLKEIRLHESSSVTFPAHEWASVTNVKANEAEGSDMALTATQLKNRRVFDMAAHAALAAIEKAETRDQSTPTGNMVVTTSVGGVTYQEVSGVNIADEIKAVCGDTSLPIGPRDEAWDGSKAHGQIVTWATKADDSLDPAKLKSVHLRVDGDATKIGSYSYPFCYIINGSPRISVGGVIAAAGALSGSRGAKSNPDSDGMKKKVATLYKKITTKYPDDPELTPPWNKSDETPGGASVKARDFTTIWTQRQTDELMNELYHMEDTLQFAIMENMCDDSVLDKDSALSAVVSQFSSQLQLWAKMYVAADAAEDAMEDAGGGDDGDDDSAYYPMSMGMMAANRADRAIKMATAYLMQLKEGKVLSGANHATIKNVVGGLQDHAKTLQQLLDDASQGADANGTANNTGGDPETSNQTANNGTSSMMDASATNSSTMPTPKSGVPDFLAMVSQMLTQKATTLSPLASSNDATTNEPGKPGQEPTTTEANDTVTTLFADMTAFAARIGKGATTP